jgi:hypothetical protein
MNARAFQLRDREVFREAWRRFGGKDLLQLQRWLGDGVWALRGGEGADSDLACFEPASLAALQVAGRLELAEVGAWLDRGTRRALGERLGVTMKTGAGWFDRQTPSPGVLRSLLGLLVASDGDDLPVEVRSGIHRWARALADQDLARVQDLAARLPGPIGALLCRIWRVLADLPTFAAQAGRIRGRLARRGA